MKPILSQSRITRPYVVSVEGDIPAGSEVKVVVYGQMSGGMSWKKEYLNPHQAPLLNPQFTTFAFTLHTSEHSLAVPFLYAIVLEGDKVKRTYTAEQFAESGNLQKMQAMLMQPDEGPAYIAPSYSSSLHVHTNKVTRSETTRPWIVEIDGEAPGGSRLSVNLTGVEPDKVEWTRTFVIAEQDTYSPLRDTLASTTFHLSKFGMDLRPSPDGHFAPSLLGLAFEGDGRRFYVPAAKLVRKEDLPEHIELLEACNTDFSFLRPKFSLPDHFGFPTAMTRVMELAHAGKLRPSWMAEDSLDLDGEPGDLGEDESANLF